MSQPSDRAFRRLLRAGLRRAPRSRPRAEGELVAMAKMARRSWRRALDTGEIVVTDRGYRWTRDPP